jgi:hypothetical protein
VPALTGWENFYVIVGSSAGALTGLQFVVAALVADLPQTIQWARSSAAFATPTIVHFGAVLVLSGIVSAPWQRLGPPMFLVGIGGAVGFVYSLIVAKRARKVKEYVPVFEDWLFHVILPAASYLTLAISAIQTRSHAGTALFGVAGAAMVLLIAGIHNAWDSVTFIVMKHNGQEQKHHDRHR